MLAGIEASDVIIAIGDVHVDGIEALHRHLTERAIEENGVIVCDSRNS